MKKKIISMCIAIIQLSVLFGVIVYAEDRKEMDQYIQKFEAIRTQELPKLDALLKQCEDRKISVDYEKADYRIIEKFIDTGINDASETHQTAHDRKLILSEYVGYGDETKPNDKSARAIYIYNSISNLANQLETTLNGYIDGSLEPVGHVEKYKTSKVAEDGYSFVAENENGERKPTFFTGYGHFGEVINDIPIFSDMGVNVIEIEVGPDKVMQLGDNGEFVFNASSDYLVKVLNAFDEAAKYNVGINLLLSPHYMPGWFYEKFPKEIVGSYFNPSDKMKEFLKVYVQGVMQAVKDKPALNSVCLTNEPGYTTSNEELELPLYIDYLKQLYKDDLNALNQNYDTKYKTFNEIKFPVKDPLYDPEKSENAEQLPALWDYIAFNDQYFANLHRYLYDLVTGVSADVLAGAKVMQDYDCDERDWRRNFLMYAMNPEPIGEFLTINGNDANNYYDPQDYQWNILNKMSYYDLQGSIRKAPVFDFEDHIIRDRNDVYGEPIMADHVAADMWQGAVHGRGGTTIWTWERSYDDSHDFSGSILNRPDEVAAESKTMLDIHRLSDELTALENTQKRIGILFSRTARIYSKFNSNSLTKVYEAASYTGERVDFVTEKQAVEGKLDQSDIDVLIVPYSTHVLDQTAEAIEAYIKKGGKVILIGDDSLVKNQYNQEINADVRNYIKNNSTTLEAVKTGEDQLASPAESDIWKTINAKFDPNAGVKLIDIKTGEAVYGVSYTYAEENGSVIVNICNYDYDNDRTVKLLNNGKPILKGVELRSMKDIDCSNITTKSIQPLLIRFDNGLFGDSQEHWAKNDIQDLWKRGIIESSTTFDPEGQMTIGAFSKLVMSAFDIQKDALTDKADNTILDRETLADMAVIILQQRQVELTGKSLEQFADAKEVSQPETMELAVGAGIIAGVSETTLSPKQAATKAEATAVINRMIKLK